MSSQYRPDYLNLADVFGVRILNFYGISVSTEIYFLYKRFLNWVNLSYSYQKDYHHSFVNFHVVIPAFDRNGTRQNCFNQILVFHVIYRKLIDGG